VPGLGHWTLGQLYTDPLHWEPPPFLAVPRAWFLFRLVSQRRGCAVRRIHPVHAVRAHFIFRTVSGHPLLNRHASRQFTYHSFTVLRCLGSAFSCTPRRSLYFHTVSPSSVLRFSPVRLVAAPWDACTKFTAFPQRLLSLPPAPDVLRTHRVAACYRPIAARAFAVKVLWFRAWLHYCYHTRLPRTALLRTTFCGRPVAGHVFAPLSPVPAAIRTHFHGTGPLHTFRRGLPCLPPPPRCMRTPLHVSLRFTAAHGPFSRGSRVGLYAVPLHFFTAAFYHGLRLIPGLHITPFARLSLPAVRTYRCYAFHTPYQVLLHPHFHCSLLDRFLPGFTIVGTFGSSHRAFLVRAVSPQRHFTVAGFSSSRAQLPNPVSFAHSADRFTPPTLLVSFVSAVHTNHVCDHATRTTRSDFVHCAGYVHHVAWVLPVSTCSSLVRGLLVVHRISFSLDISFVPGLLRYFRLGSVHHHARDHTTPDCAHSYPLLRLPFT